MPLLATAARASVAAAERHELWEERAAIMEYDGGLQRDFAEEEARRDVARRWPVARSTERANTKGAGGP